MKGVSFVGIVSLWLLLAGGICSYADIPQEKRGHKHYTVQRGDTLYGISQEYGVEVEDLRRWNNIKDKSMIVAGRELVIKTEKRVTAGIKTASAKSYIVKKDDTLNSISSRLGTSTEAIMTRNSHIKNKNVIHPGQKVTIYRERDEPIIPEKTEHTRKTTRKEEYYRVRPGDTLIKIARRFHLSLDKLLALNPKIENKDIIHTGQRIFLDRDPDVFSPRKFEQEEKRILKRVGKRTGVDWKILYGLCKKESNLGRVMVGDNGKALGWFQIHTGYHPDVTVSRAMDLEWAAEWAAGYLIKMGYHQNKFNALRKYNGSLRNPVTGRRAKQVLAYADDIGG